MKKNSILKALGLTFAIVILLSWVIPAGTYTNGAYTATGSTSPIGLYDFLRLPVLTLATFVQYGLFFLAIGGFYGVLNQTGVYSNLINNIVKKWNKKKKSFLIITILTFIMLTSLTGLSNVMFILVPFFATILLKLGYDKITSFTSTVGAILLGNVGCTFGFEIWGYLKTYLNIEMTTLIFARIVVLIMISILMILFLIKNTKEVKKSKDEEVLLPLYEEVKSKKSSVPFIVISVLTFILLMVGGYNWYYAFDIEFFTELYNSVSAIQIGGKTIISDILALNNAPMIGFFENYDITIILVFISLIMGWIYNVKFNDIVSGFANGAKKMLLPATYATLSCVIFATVLNSSGGHFINTIINKFIGTEGFSFMGTVGSSIVTSFVYNDFSSMLSSIYTIFTSYDANVIPVVAFIIQGIFGLISLIAPTSIILVAGLSLMDISYKEWIKYIYKFALIIFGILIVVAFILTTLI